MKKDVDKEVVAMEHIRLLPGNNACVVQFSRPLLARKKHFCRFHCGSASPEGIKNSDDKDDRRSDANHKKGHLKR
ncbi:hypothetical protein EH164_08375 [Kosakonia sp. CCTCC M2018092]|uniref:hypothetical protein n=1 Tax=Kosakonia sp. CCTCC M2018092 TaxID=2492396 RepID=UPI000F606806|nr:hypothetical protein [Kosakonia sp. CCTCC M2018092]AZI87065.1 hypothetical protein EH164_08375 [Kosakonia sp. CCTCC M2018092]